MESCLKLRTKTKQPPTLERSYFPTPSTGRDNKSLALLFFAFNHLFTTVGNGSRRNENNGEPGAEGEERGSRRNVSDVEVVTRDKGRDEKKRKRRRQFVDPEAGGPEGGENS